MIALAVALSVAQRHRAAPAEHEPEHGQPRRVSGDPVPRATVVTPRPRHALCALQRPVLASEARMLRQTSLETLIVSIP